MVFNSLQFLAFFPLVTLAYFLLPRRHRWLWLLAASYYFYMCWNVRYVLLILLSTAVTYACGLLAEGTKQPALRRGIVVAGLGINLGILAAFKYYGFFTDLLIRGAGMLGLSLRLPAFDVLLPVGISFYTFQALGYMLDVSAGRIRAERSFLRYALFVSFFPQLVAGPIERSGNLLHQVNEAHDFDFDRMCGGLSVMLLGFFEKLIIADRAALYVDVIYSHWQEASGAQLALATMLFALQVYCDFSGYSHIAIGAAKVLGFDLMENFRQPYFAVSVRDFWHRWHISLSTWFRDYLYIPLGGSRKGRLRTICNTMITFLVSGLWHGASLTYVVWGGLNGLLQVIEGFLPQRRRTLPLPERLLRCVLTFVLVDLTWLFFRASSLSTALRILSRILRCFAAAPMSTGFSLPQGIVLAAGLVLLFALDLRREIRGSKTAARSGHPALSAALALIAVLMIVLLGIWGPAYSAQSFIYFQF